MRTMLIVKENEFMEFKEWVYKVPLEAIKLYMETDSTVEVDQFLENEYISDDTEMVLDLCLRKNLKFEEIIHPKDKEKPFDFYNNRGVIYDTDYGIYDTCYENVDSFINHFAKLEVESAISDCKIICKDYQKDELYIKFNRLLEKQTISENELEEIMGMCNYAFNKNTLEIIEVNEKSDNVTNTFQSIDEAKESVIGYLNDQLSIYGDTIDSVLEKEYIKTIRELPVVDSIEELNIFCEGLINYKYIVWYEMLYRPVSIGCQPDGFYKTDDQHGNHGVVAYTRELTVDELKEYEMINFVH